MEKILKLIKESIENGKIDNSILEKIKTELDTLVNEKAENKAKEIIKTKKLITNEEVNALISTKIEEQLNEQEELIETQIEGGIKEKLKEFSKFVDLIVEEVSEELIEELEYYALLGEEYEDIIEPLKEKIAIDSNELPQEIEETIEEASEKIDELESKIDELTSENLKLHNLNEKMSTVSFLQEKTKDLNPVISKIIIEHFEDCQINDESELEEEVDEFISNILKLTESSNSNDDDDDLEESIKDDDIPNPGNKKSNIDQYLEFWNK